MVFSLTGAIFLFAHPFFRLESVSVSGIQHTDRSEISNVIQSYLSERTALFFTNQNKFLFRAEELAARMNASFTFRDLQIERDGTQVHLKAVERTSQLLWQSENQLYIVDLEGIVVRTVQPEEREHIQTILPLFIDRNDVTVGVGDPVLVKKEIESIFRFHEHLSLQHIPFVRTEFDRLAGKWVGVITQTGFQILFDPSADVDEQAARLEVLMRDKIKDQTSLQYIDLRFGDHVYYK